MGRGRGGTKGGMNLVGMEAKNSARMPFADVQYFEDNNDEEDGSKIHVVLFIN